MTPDQKEEIRKIFERNEDRLKELHDQVHRRLGEVRERLKTEIDGVLTLDQRKKLDALLERHMEAERGRRTRYSGRPSPPAGERKGEHP
jgi:predicted component of type VI protein secretion system